MIAVLIKLEGIVEGVQAFSRIELADQAIEKWEREVFDELVRDGDIPADEEFEAPAIRDNRTDPDDSYGGWEYQLVHDVELDGKA